VALQSLIKIVSCETDVVLHPAAVGTLEVQQVQGALVCYETMAPANMAAIKFENLPSRAG
jgi:hypothetical protein